MTDALFDRVFCVYLAANIRVAANLTLDARRCDVEDAWKPLIARAAAAGCDLRRCYLDPQCDGECGCGAGMTDRDGLFASFLTAEESDADELAMFTRLVARAEETGGSIQ